MIYSNTTQEPVEIITTLKSFGPISGHVVAGEIKPAEFRYTEVVRSFRFIEVTQDKFPGGADRNNADDCGGSATSGLNEKFRDSCIRQFFEDGRNRGPFLIDPDTGAIKRLPSYNRVTNCYFFQASDEENLSESDLHVQTLQIDLSDLAPSFKVSDTPGGNKDGAVDPGEKLRVTVALSNARFRPANSAAEKHHDARRFYCNSGSGKEAQHRNRRLKCMRNIKTL